jgi:hypothetical protein
MKQLKSLIIFTAVISMVGCGDKEGSSSSSTASAPPFVEQLKFPLKVQDIGLGVVRAPCAPVEETYVDIMQKPVRTQFECTIGGQSDSTTIVFSGDAKSVVRVTRKQYLLPSDPEPKQVVQGAINFYGNPSQASLDNWLANYGDAYTINMDGNRAYPTMSDSGIGLLIKGSICADGNYGTEKCGNLGTSLMKYDLIDVVAYKQQIDDGKARLSAKAQANINNQKF